MMIRIAVVEDEDSAEQSLRENLESWNVQKKYSFHIERYRSAEDFLEKYDSGFDVVFMDIELNGMDGVRAAKKLREFDEQVVLIFVTNMKKYVVSGYEVGALNYIVKPINFFSFSLTMDRCMRRLESRGADSICVKIPYGFKKIQCSDIYYVDIVKHELLFHTVSGGVKTYGNLKEWENKLESFGFVRCNASAIVNLRHVESVIGDDIHIGGDVIRISRTKKKSFLETFTMFIGEKR